MLNNVKLRWTIIDYKRFPWIFNAINLAYYIRAQLLLYIYFSSHDKTPFLTLKFATNNWQCCKYIKHFHTRENKYFLIFRPILNIIRTSVPTLRIFWMVPGTSAKPLRNLFFFWKDHDQLRLDFNIWIFLEIFAMSRL